MATTACTRKIKQTCEWTKTAEISDALPSLEQFLNIFQRRRFISMAALLNHHKPRQRRLGAPPPPRVVSFPGEPVATGMPWHGRLRSSSTLHLKNECVRNLTKHQKQCLCRHHPCRHQEAILVNSFQQQTSKLRRDFTREYQWVGYSGDHDHTGQQHRQQDRKGLR